MFTLAFSTHILGYTQVREQFSGASLFGQSPLALCSILSLFCFRISSHGHVSCITISQNGGDVHFMKLGWGEACASRPLGTLQLNEVSFFHRLPPVRRQCKRTLVDIDGYPQPGDQVRDAKMTVRVRVSGVRAKGCARLKEPEHCRKLQRLLRRHSNRHNVRTF